MSKRFKAKFIVCILLICTISAAISFAGAGSSYAVSEEEQQAIDEISESIDEQLGNLDLGELEKIISGLGSNEKGIFGAGSFLDKVNSIINGDFAVGYDNIFQALLGLVFSDFAEVAPILATIVGICVLYSITSNLKNKGKTDSAVYLACYGVIVLIVFASVVKIVLAAKDAIVSMQTQMEAVFPVLLTVMTGLGANSSVAVYQPAIAILSNLILQLLTLVILPVFLLGTVLNFVGNISSNTRLSKLSDFFFSTSKWMLGIIFLLFTAFLAIQGITAGTHDGVSIRTAKYALSHYIPIIGGYLSEGFNLIMAGGMLIKNAVGFSGAVLLIATVLPPIIKIFAFSLCMKLTAAIIQPFCDNKIGDFLTAVGKSFNLLIAMIAGVAFIYFISLVLIICTGNFALAGG